MPLGGIGAGCVCFNGYGGLQDFSIRHRPSTTALPDGHDPREAVFALLHVKGREPVTRLLEGPLPPEKIYDQGLQAQGYRHGGHEGLPRFLKSRFRSGYPFGEVALKDPAVPLAVRITGWSPFVPRDDVASGLPCAILEYKFRNMSRKVVEFEFSFHASHLASGSDSHGKGTRNSILPGGGGVLFSNTLPADAEAFGTASVSVLSQEARPPRLKAMWLRGEWFDALSALWREVAAGQFEVNDGSATAGEAGRNGGSLLVPCRLGPEEETTIPVVLTWHFPNSHQRYGGTDGLTWATHGTHPDKLGPTGEPPAWRPFYVRHWADAAAVAEYVRQHFEALRARTLAFQQALFSTDAPTELLDAVSANLAILKSPTVMRQENGNVWAWEGCFTEVGCCHGSCTHVWNYAQAMPHLFPALERTLREQELERSIDDTGHVNFRSALPDGPAPHDFHAAADGQLGGPMKLYRDWHISGDTAWVARLYPAARRSLEYCIRTWDPDRRGALAEPHHNTYDIEFCGPDGMCGSIYVGALCAVAAMARALGYEADAAEYSALSEQAAQFLETELFNGEYFEQRVQWEGLRDQTFLEQLSSAGNDKNKEILLILKKEGPKYQYGRGCLSDGIIGAWMAGQYGIGTPLDLEKVRTSLRAIHRHNFRRSLREHVCTQRPGYATGNEPGLLVCSWPRGGKPTLPFVYSDEVWTGIEYQVASHLIAEGCVEEGLEIVCAVRSRYDGRVRNPWNEYECGSFYARAMASYALVSAWSGFRYSAVERTLWFGPARPLEKRLAFQTFFSSATGYGTIRLDKRALTISMVEGELIVKQAVIRLGLRKITSNLGGTARPNSPVRIELPTT